MRKASDQCAQTVWTRQERRRKLFFCQKCRFHLTKKTKTLKTTPSDRLLPVAFARPCSIKKSLLRSPAAQANVQQSFYCEAIKSGRQCQRRERERGCRGRLFLQGVCTRLGGHVQSMTIPVLADRIHAQLIVSTSVKNAKLQKINAFGCFFLSFLPLSIPSSLSAHWFAVGYRNPLEMLSIPIENDPRKDMLGGWCYRRLNDGNLNSVTWNIWKPTSKSRQL